MSNSKLVEMRATYDPEKYKIRPKRQKNNHLTS